MICKNCGFEFEEGSVCPQCGASADFEEKTDIAENGASSYGTIENSEFTEKDENESPTENTAEQETGNGEQVKYEFQNEDDFPPYEKKDETTGGETKPRKKGVIAAIIIAIVVVVAVAVAAVAAFTDVFVSKKSSFTALSENYASSLAAPASDLLDNGKRIEADFSVTLNKSNPAFTTFESNNEYAYAVAQMRDIINSHNLKFKFDVSKGITKSAVSLSDGDGELIGLHAILSDAKSLLKTNFSDVGINLDTREYGESDYASIIKNVKQPDKRLLEDMKKAAENAFKNAFDESEFVNGTYSGAFDVNTKAITLKMPVDKAVEVVFEMLEASMRVTGCKDYFNENVTPFLETMAKDLDYDVLGITGFDYDSCLGYLSIAKSKVRESVGKNGIPEDLVFELSILYSGDFAFARKVAGFSLKAQTGEVKVEIISYDNGTDSAVYGVNAKNSANDGNNEINYKINNKYSVNSGVKKGRITLDFGGIGIFILPQVSSDSQDAHEYGNPIKGLYVDYETSDYGNYGKYEIVYNNEYGELFRLTLNTKPCDPFEVEIDDKKCVDVIAMFMSYIGAEYEDGDFDPEPLEKFVQDAQKWLEDNMDRPLVQIIGSLIALQNDYGYDYDYEDDYYYDDYDFNDYDDEFWDDEDTEYVDADDDSFDRIKPPTDVVSYS